MPRGPLPKRSPAGSARMEAGPSGWCPIDGTVRQDFGGAPVFLVEFFERMLRYEDKPAWHRVHDRALNYMLQTNIEKNLWGTYHEDILLKPQEYLSAEPMCFTADYLFRRGKAHPEYVEMGRGVIRRMEERLVHTEGHAAAPGAGCRRAGRVQPYYARAHRAVLPGPGGPLLTHP